MPEAQNTDTAVTDRRKDRNMEEQRNDIVSNAREASFNEPETFKALDRKNAFNQEKNQPQANNVQNDEKVKKTSSKFSLFKKKKKDYEVGEDSESEKDDPFTMALERSFGTEDPATFDKEPRFDAPIDTSSRSLSRSESDSSAFTFNSESSKVVSFVDAAAVNLPKSIKNNAKEPWHDEEQLDIEDFTGHPQEKNDNSENLSETVDFDDTRKPGSQEPGSVCRKSPVKTGLFLLDVVK